MIVGNMNVRTLIVIISIVTGTTNYTLFLLSVGPNKIYLRKVKNLMMFKRRKFMHVLLHGSLWAEGNDTLGGS